MTHVYCLSLLWFVFSAIIMDIYCQKIHTTKIADKRCASSSLSPNSKKQSIENIYVRFSTLSSSLSVMVERKDTWSLTLTPPLTTTYWWCNHQDQNNSAQACMSISIKSQLGTLRHPPPRKPREDLWDIRIDYYYVLLSMKTHTLSRTKYK